MDSANEHSLYTGLTWEEGVREQSFFRNVNRLKDEKSGYLIFVRPPGCFLGCWVVIHFPHLYTAFNTYHISVPCSHCCHLPLLPN